MTVAGLPPAGTEAVDVLMLGNAAGPSAFAAALQGDKPVTLAPDSVESQSFDAAADRWIVTTVTGTRIAARVVVAAHEPASSTGLIPLGDARARFGDHAYLGIARHGFPNYWVTADTVAGAYAAACTLTMFDRGCTRIEVKMHVQAQYSRNLDAGLQRLNPRARNKPDLSDFEFTSDHDREDDEDYRGPAVLIEDDGTEVAVEVHLLAVFQPIDNAVRWSGRVLPCAELAGLHRRTNQAVTIRIGDGPALPALLIDADPWGGAHIVGTGASPYPMPLVAELARITHP